MTPVLTVLRLRDGRVIPLNTGHDLPGVLVAVEEDCLALAEVCALSSAYYYYYYYYYYY